MSKNPYFKLQPSISKPYTSIYLIRHAHPDYGLAEELGDNFMPLDKKGRDQAKLLAKYLKKLNINKVFASTITRAQETAQIFAKAERKRVFVEKGLDEVDWVEWHKVRYFRTSEERRKQYLPNYHELDRQLDRRQAEARRLLDNLTEKNRGKNLAVFAHGNLIRIMLTSIINADVIGFLSLEINQASISHILVDKDNYVKVIAINHIDHLAGLYSEED